MTMEPGIYADAAGKLEHVQAQRRQVAELLHTLASLIETFATAMDEDDGIIGPLAGEGIANTLAALPRHVREMFLEHASDEAHAGFLADRRYGEQQESETGAGVS